MDSSRTVTYFLPPEVSLAPAKTSGGLRVAGADTPVVFEWIKKFYAETLQADLPKEIKRREEGNFDAAVRLFVWWDAMPVAMGMLAGARINLIYVPPEFRGRGYGRAVVSALAARARESGQVPMLFASADNSAANSLYSSLGFCEGSPL